MSNDTTIWRGGMSSSRAYRVPDKPSWSAREGRLSIAFVISSAGGGESIIEVKVGSGDYREILDCMLEADGTAALAAMSSALATALAVDKTEEVSED
jgi:predicted methyltransferase